MAERRKSDVIPSQQPHSRKSILAGGIGLALVLLSLLPCLILGEKGVYTYHDQLDGEMIAYLLQAKHLGDGGILPEFMSGAAKTALIPPAPGAVLLFVLFPPLAALFLMQLSGCLTGYIGMYLLVREKTKDSVAAAAAGFLYAMIPFLPVYGLSQYGLPLLLWCVLSLRTENDGSEHVRKTDKNGIGVKSVVCLAYGAVFALNSSLVLDGFAVLSVCAVWCALDWIRYKKMPVRTVLFVCLMTTVYLLTNISLIAQVLGIGEREISHKAEYVLAAERVPEGLRNAFLYGGQHSADHHLGILALALLTLGAEQIYAYCARKQTKAGQLDSGEAGYGKPGCGKKTGYGQVILWCMGCNFGFAGISALWNGSAGISLRTHMGAAGAFQMDRFLWLSPCLWYLMLGCCTAYALAQIRESVQARQMRAGLAAAVALTVAALIVAGGTGLALLKDSDVKANLQKLRDPEYPMMSFADYYAVGVLEQVKDYLYEERGMTPEEYRVVSLGIDPAAALYHGFYCLDGYSNNYSLAYKHAFRRVIAPALEQSEYLRAYFDDWGNRCYLFGTESPGYYTIEKGGFYFEHLELDTAALRELGGDYLLSAAYIANSNELGLTLLGDEAFETSDSYYRIFLYEVANE
ncbi:MAG: hypothetical protein IJ147_10675 [Lachnospiraceae bacterium]|nr:hypothetical protein [Lachnospiraceae bacterium]